MRALFLGILVASGLGWSSVGKADPMPAEKSLGSSADFVAAKRLKIAQKISAHCVVDPLSTPYVMIAYASAACQQVLQEWMAFENQNRTDTKVPVCTLRNRPAFQVQLECPAGWSQEMLTHILDTQRLHPPVQNPATACQRVGVAGSQRMTFAFTYFCIQALQHATTENADWKQQRCETFASLADPLVLTLSCENQLPTSLAPLQTDEAHSEAYQQGIVYTCERVGVLDRQRVHFTRTSACQSMLSDALRNKWAPLQQANCFLSTNSTDSTNVLTLACRKPLPTQLVTAYPEKKSGQ